MELGSNLRRILNLRRAISPLVFDRQYSLYVHNDKEIGKEVIYSIFGEIKKFTFYQFCFACEDN